jgi:hypothetical protein
LSLAKSGDLPFLRKLQPPKKGDHLPKPTETGNSARPYRVAHLIGDIAIVEASRREENCERAGLIYMLGEILTALHRQAEALENNTALQEFLISRFTHQDKTQ